MASDERPSLFEQHAQTILAGIALVAITSAVALLLLLREDVSVLKTTVSHLNAQIQQGVDDRFRGSDWRREERSINERFQRIERRIEKIEEGHQHKMTPVPGAR